MNRLNKLVLFFLLTIPGFTQVAITPTATVELGKDPDITAASVENFSVEKLASRIDEKKEIHSITNFDRFKSWKFEKSKSLLPQQYQSTRYWYVSSDESNDYYALGVKQQTILVNGKSGAVIYQSSGLERDELTKNGKYLISVPSQLNSEEDEMEHCVVYQVPTMTKVPLGSGIANLQSIGNGRFAIGEMQGQKGIVDLENPSFLVKTLSSGDPLLSLENAESEDGNWYLVEDKQGMFLYHLPDFKLVQKYNEFGLGDPFINSNGSIVGCKRYGVCYFENRTTGKIKGYGINSQNCSELIQCAYVQRHFEKREKGKVVARKPVMQDYVTKITRLSDFKMTKQLDGETSDQPVSHGSSDGGDCGVEYLYSSGKGTGVWVVIDHSSAVGSGETYLLNVGDDLGIKRVLKVDGRFLKPFWDEETNSLVGMDANGNYLQAEVTP